MEKSEETLLYQRAAQIKVGLDGRGEAADRVEGEVSALSSTPTLVLRQILRPRITSAAL